MDLSIIIPCHNLENYIKPLLLSFQILDYSNINTEFIFVLDACTDKTCEQIKKYMPEVTTQYHIYECDYHSCGFARNLGFKHSKGEYIWFIDGDDWIINPRILSDAISILKKTCEPILQIKFVSNFYQDTFFSMVWQYIFKRNFIEDISFPKQQPDEDIAFMIEVFHKFGKTELTYYNIPSYYYNYRRPGSNTTLHFEKQNSNTKI